MATPENRRSQAKGGDKLRPKSRRKGRGKKGKGKPAEKPKKKDKSSLDADLDSYMLKDKKFAATKLNSDLDDYMAAAAKAKEEKKEETKKEFAPFRLPRAQRLASPTDREGREECASRALRRGDLGTAEAIRLPLARFSEAGVAGDREDRASAGVGV